MCRAGGGLVACSRVSLVFEQSLLDGLTSQRAGLNECSERDEARELTRWMQLTGLWSSLAAQY